MDKLVIRHLGHQAYLPVWQAMQQFTELRQAETTDEIWVLEHPPIFTLGRAGKAEHLLNPGTIPVLHIDRGGQVTYHGPGQLILYMLLDVRRRGLGVRQLVEHIEQSIIKLLVKYGIVAESRRDAPGVYVNNAKIAALGLRVRHNGSFHGMSLNIDMDLEPFSRINPCGYADLVVTQISDLLDNWDHEHSDQNQVISQELLAILTDALGYDKITSIEDTTLPTIKMT